VAFAEVGLVEIAQDAHATVETQELIAARASFISETVFSQPSKRVLVRDGQEAAYHVTLHVVHLPEDTTVARVHDRLRRGGHTVPEEKIRQRYQRMWGFVDGAGAGSAHVRLGQQPNGEAAAADRQLRARPAGRYRPLDRLGAERALPLTRGPGPAPERGRQQLNLLFGGASSGRAQDPLQPTRYYGMGRSCVTVTSTTTWDTVLPSNFVHGSPRLGEAASEPEWENMMLTVIRWKGWSASLDPRTQTGPRAPGGLAS
jgi:Zeta toxin